MWKKIISSILLFYCFIIMIGCSNKNSEIALLSLQEVRDESKKTMEEVRKNEYKNLIFEDFTPKITNADEIYKICIGKKVLFVRFSTLFGFRHPLVVLGSILLL